MQFAKVRWDDKSVGVGVVERGHVRPLDLRRDPAIRTLSDLLYSPDPRGAVNRLVNTEATSSRVEDVTLLAPVDHQEIWAAGVTYKRSKVAREEESKGAA